MALNDAVDKLESTLGSPGAALAILAIVIGFIGVVIGVIVALSLSLNLIPMWLQKAFLVALVVIVLLLLVIVVLILVSVVGKKPSRKKATYTALAAAAAIILVSSVVLGWPWITATPKPLPYVTSAITITNPADGDRISGMNVTVRGTSQISVPNQSIWVLVYPQAAPSRFYPQQPVTEERDGRWACNVYLGTSNPSSIGNYDVYAVLLNNASATNFQNYLDNSNQQHSWPGVSSQPGVISYDHITLTRVQ